MLEESVENFMTRWRPYAAEVELFPRVEGSPLIEFMAAGKVLQAFERTAPYLVKPGAAKLVINPVIERLEPSEMTSKSLLAPVVGRIKANGLVLLKEAPFLVVDAGVPLVVGVQGNLPEQLAIGDWVSFESLAPVHGFVLEPPRGRMNRSDAADAI